MLSFSSIDRIFFLADLLLSLIVDYTSLFEYVYAFIGIFGFFKEGQVMLQASLLCEDERKGMRIVFFSFEMMQTFLLFFDQGNWLF